MKKVFKVGLNKTKEKIKLFDIGETVAAVPENLSSISFTGNKEVHIDGYKSIMEYTDIMIKINLGKGFITFSGTELSISSLYDNNISINGLISTVEFS